MSFFFFFEMQMLIAMETGIIPPNLHFREPNPYIPGLKDGRLKVVTEKTPWEPGFIGINSFGFGGSNTHIVLGYFCQIVIVILFLPMFFHSVPRKNPHERETVPKSTIPKLFCYSGRTQDAVKAIFDIVGQQNDDVYLYNLLSEQSATPTNLFPYRGFSLTPLEQSKSSPLVDVQVRFVLCARLFYRQ